MVHGNTTVRRDDMVRATTTTISTNPAIIDLSRFGVHVRAGTAFILTRKLRHKHKACPTCSYPGS
jgi:hypothetical protein